MIYSIEIYREKKRAKASKGDHDGDNASSPRRVKTFNTVRSFGVMSR